jgi:hypothetical protein
LHLIQVHCGDIIPQAEDGTVVRKVHTMENSDGGGRYQNNEKDHRIASRNVGGRYFDFTGTKSYLSNIRCASVKINMGTTNNKREVHRIYVAGSCIMSRHPNRDSLVTTLDRKTISVT